MSVKSSIVPEDHLPVNDFPFPVPETRFDQRNEMFKRRTWDPEIKPHGDRLYHTVKYQDKPGFRKLDYALRNAAWHIEYGYAFGNQRGNSGLYGWDYVSPKVQKFIDAGGPVTHDPETNSRIVKRAARFLGADLAGVCFAHPNLVYSHEMDLVEQKHRPVQLPDGCDHAVVMAVEMDYETSRYSPDGISGAATGLGYSMQAVLANLVATFIRGLGYRAVPSGNDTAISIPLAIAAGLGELGRSGLLITEKYGPRVRICKVFTDMPLAHDTVRPFGVAAFCKTCKKCARQCPSHAISHGEPTTVGPSASNHSGVQKWYINPEKCFLFWVKNWMDCNNCVAVCPFNKPAGWTHDLARWMIRRLPVLNPLWVKLDDLLGYGKLIPTKKKRFWDAM